MANITARDIFKGMETRIDLDPPDHTLSKKLVINVAPTGSFVTRKQNPNQPFTLKEVARAAIQSCRAGASMWHIHCRDEEGIPSKDPAVIKQTVDMVMAECPDIITSVNVISGYGLTGREMYSPIAEPLRKAGQKYIRTAVVTPITMNPSPKVALYQSMETLQDQVAYLTESGIKPEFQIHNYQSLKNVEEWLIKPGLLKPPCLMNIVLGWHAYNYSAPAAPTWAGFQYLTMMRQLLPENTIVGVSAGGRNWLPMTVAAILLGADVVRVGMEDTLWMYPHREERLTVCEETVQKVAAVANELGREVATPKEALDILALRS